MLNLSFASLFGGLVFGTIGFFAFRQGRRSGSVKTIGIGVALMIYPYFIPNTVLLYVVGVLLTASLFFFRD